MGMGAGGGGGYKVQTDFLLYTVKYALAHLQRDCATILPLIFHLTSNAQVTNKKKSNKASQI
jgi:hypothetical protein